MLNRTAATLGRVITVLLLATALNGCGGGESPTPPPAPDATLTTVPSDLKALFGAGCRTLPRSKSDPRSPEWMTKRSARDIVSHAPDLTELYDALKRTNLLSSLDKSNNITLLFPTNAAFAKVAGWRMAYVRANIPLFRRIVNHHVVPRSLNPKQLNLEGPHPTLEGQELRVYGFGERLGIGKERAHVICGNIRASNNMTVYLIDRVLSVV
jgi:uncharacterized surface protein with fasciclin (FAS1) repeats